MFIKELLERLLNQKIRKYSYKYRLQNLIKDYEVSAIIDVGANTGQFVLWSQSTFCGNVKSVYSFEPLLLAYNELRRNSLKSVFSFEWKVFNLALSNKNSISWINVSSGDGTSSSLHDLLENSRVSNSGREQVELKTFDSLQLDLSLHQSLLVKIDVQGHEMSVLLGMKDFLDSRRPLVLLEVSNVSSYQENHSLLDYLKFFESIRYELLWIEHNILDVTIDREWDVCLVPKTSIF